MKKSKSFCKLLSAISAVAVMGSVGVLDNHVKAMKCEEVVNYLSCNSVHLAFGEDFWLFGQERMEAGSVVWKAFMQKMRESSQHYMLDMWCEEDEENADSVNFLYLVLHIYKTALDRISPREAEEAVRNMWRGYRNSDESSNDRVMLDELINFHSDKAIRTAKLGKVDDAAEANHIAQDFKKLKSIFQTI